MAHEFPIAPARIVATLAALLEAQNQRQLADVLRAAAARIEETDYNDWNGGTYYYALHLELPVAQYAKVEPDLSKIESAIAAKLESALRTAGNDILNTVVITPAFEELGSDSAGAVPEEEADRLWAPGMFRLFLSHVSSHKVAVSSLKRELDVYGVSGFVAHEDIEPSLEWQAEIELALRSMHAMAALLTPDFHESKWTDQEIGMAIGQGFLVLPVRIPLDPYGFVAKSQGLRGDLTKPAELASKIVAILLKRPRTVDAMREGLLVALELSKSFAASKAVTATIESTVGFTSDQLDRIEASIETNSQVRDSFGVPERLRGYTVARLFDPAGKFIHTPSSGEQRPLRS